MHLYFQHFCTDLYRRFIGNRKSEQQRRSFIVQPWLDHAGRRRL